MSEPILLNKIKELGRKNKLLLDSNRELKESLEFATGFCAKCNETVCPIRKALRKARGEAECPNL